MLLFAATVVLSGCFSPRMQTLEYKMDDGFYRDIVKGGIPLTGLTTICCSRWHGRISPESVGIGAGVFDGASVPRISVSVALAGRVPLSGLRT